MGSGFIVKPKEDWDDDVFRKFFIDMSIIAICMLSEQHVTASKTQYLDM